MKSQKNNRVSRFTLLIINYEENLCQMNKQTTKDPMR